MRFILEEDFEILEEDFTSRKNLEAHYYKHIVQNKEYDWTIEEYEDHANKLALSPIDNKKILGFIGERNGRIYHIKWDKDLEFYVVYYWKNKDPRVITAFKRSFRDYNGKKFDDYIDEISDENFLRK